MPPKTTNKHQDSTSDDDIPSEEMDQKNPLPDWMKIDSQSRIIGPGEPHPWHVS